MKKLLRVILSLQSVMFSCLSIVGCKQTVRTSNSSTSTGSISALDTYKKAVENLENSQINLSVLQNKNELIKQLEIVIKSKIDQANIQSNSLKIYDKNNNLEITDVNQTLIKVGFEAKVELVLEHNGSQLPVTFNCKVVNENISALDTYKKAVENLENSQINLSVLQNKNELIKQLETVIKSKTDQANIQSNSLKIYDKNNNLEITDVNQTLIKVGFEAKVELVLEHNGSQLPVTFNCKVADKDMIELNNLKEKIENLLQPFEVKIGKTFDAELLSNFILNHFQNNNYITNSNVRFFSKFEFFNLNLQNPIAIGDIKFDTPFMVKVNISSNSTVLPIIFKVKLIHSIDLDILDSSIKKIQSYNDFKFYMASSYDFTVRGKKHDFLKDMFATNELKENIDQIDIIHNLGFDMDHYLQNTKIINKTNGNELKIVGWKQKVISKGTFKIKDGELPFEFSIELTDPSQIFDIQFLSRSLLSVIHVNAPEYIKSKNYPSLSKQFIIQMIQDIFTDEYKDHISKHDSELSDWEFYKFDKITGKFVITTNDSDIKYNEDMFVKGRVRIKNNYSIYGIFIGKINFFKP